MREDNKPNLGELYRSGAKQFEEYIKDSFSWKYIEEPALKHSLKDLSLKDIKILDAGCGNGRVIKYLISHGATEENITGIDLSPELIANAKVQFPKAQFICSDMSDSELKIDRVELITSSMSLAYLDNNQFDRALKNFHRWLDVNGHLIYIILHPIRLVHDNLGDYFVRNLKEIQTPWGPMTHHFHRTVADYINSTIEAGFQIKAVDEPEVLEEGKKHPEDYKKYTAFPSRLAIRAKNQEIGSNIVH